MEQALLAAVALVNTAARGEEQLTDDDALAEFARQQDYLSSALTGPGQLQRVRRLRARLRRAWEITDEEELVGFLNEGLDESHSRPALVRHDGWDWHVHYTPVGAPLERIMLAETCMALVTVFVAKEWSRLRICAGEDCDAVIVDLSRNRSRRYCDVANCGNRANVAAYRARRRQEGAG